MSKLKLAAGSIVLAIILLVAMLLLVPLLPWRLARIKLCNHFGTAIGKSIVWITGVDLTVVGRDKVGPDRPAIYVGNHSSLLDAFTSIWLSPLGTVGVAKKQIYYYPIYGLGYLLSGHVVIDRANTERAIASMTEMTALVKRYGLHIYMWPEGTLSRDGRLMPFKKGFAHLALQTGLPIVPIVTTNGHIAVDRPTLTIRPVPMTITFLDPIDTSEWRAETLDQHVAEVRQVMIDALPEGQRPLE